MKNKHGKSTRYMLDFVKQYIDGDMEQWAFDLDFDGRLIEHFPKIQRENEAFAGAYVMEIADRVDYARDNALSEVECRALTVTVIPPRARAAGLCISWKTLLPRWITASSYPQGNLPLCGNRVYHKLHSLY